MEGDGDDDQNRVPPTPPVKEGGDGGGEGLEKEEEEDGGEKHGGYDVPVLKELPAGIASNQRVIALTCFKLHSAHAPEVALAARGGRRPSTAAASESTNTENIASSAKELASNRTNRHAIPSFAFSLSLHPVPDAH